MSRRERLRRVDLQVSLLTAAIVICACMAVYFVSYHLTYADMIYALQERVLSIHAYLEPYLTAESFVGIRNAGDEQRETYRRTKALLENVKNVVGVRYLYTAAKTEDGEYIYLVDGLPSNSDDFRHAGDEIEPEIIQDMETALSGESVLPDEIKATSWGYIFISYLPVHDGEKVVGVLGIEFDAEHQYRTFRTFRMVTPFLIAGACLLGGLVAMVLFRRISNPTYQDLATTDFLTGLRNRNAFEVAAGNLKDPRGMLGMSLVVVDLDGLKRVNDTMGHLAGDAYIIACSQALTAVTPKGEAVYRMGGDEFAVVLHAGEEGAKEYIRKLEEWVTEDNRTAEIPLGYSAGYAVCDPKLDENLYSTLDRADTMMYENKRQKRSAPE